MITILNINIENNKDVMKHIMFIDLFFNIVNLEFSNIIADIRFKNIQIENIILILKLYSYVIKNNAIITNDNICEK